MNKAIISQTEKYALNFYKCEYLQTEYEDKNLWENHIRLTRKYARILAQKENVDADIVEVAAILHDIGKCEGRKGHDVKSYELSKEYVGKLDISDMNKELILKCILKHSSKYSHEDNEIEVKVIQSADALGTFFDEVWQQHCRYTMDKEEILKLYEKSYNKINLESAREIVKPQIEKLKALLNRC